MDVICCSTISRLLLGNEKETVSAVDFSCGNKSTFSFGSTTQPAMAIKQSTMRKGLVRTEAAMFIGKLEYSKMKLSFICNHSKKDDEEHSTINLLFSAHKKLIREEDWGMPKT